MVAAPGGRRRNTSLRVAIHFTGRPTRFAAHRISAILGISEVLGAEAAADIGGDEAHRVRRHAQRARRQVAVAVDVLAGDVQRVAVRPRIGADRAARFHRVGDDAMVVELQPHDMRRRREGRLHRGGIARAPVHADIAGHLVGDSSGASGASAAAAVVTAGSGA